MTVFQLIFYRDFINKLQTREFSCSLHNRTIEKEKHNKTILKSYAEIVIQWLNAIDRDFIIISKQSHINHKMQSNSYVPPTWISSLFSLQKSTFHSRQIHIWLWWWWMHVHKNINFNDTFCSLPMVFHSMMAVDEKCENKRVFSEF